MSNRPRYIHQTLLFASLGCFCFTACPLLGGENWPQWRGPEGTSISNEAGLPIVWHEKRNILWKCPLPEWGTSTPAIWGDAVFVTSHTSENKLLLLRINKADGKIVWQQEVGTGEATRKGETRQGQKFHDLHNLASPSPVTNGKVVVAHFGNGDLAAYDFAGQQLWKRNLQTDYGTYSIWWGHANSPVIVGDFVISVCMQDSLADLQDKPVESYLVAHDLESGDEVWKTARQTKASSEECDSYTTPIVTQLEGTLQLIVMGGNQLDSYDPQTGKQIWFLSKLVGGRTITGPTVQRGMVYATRGMRGELVAFKPKAGENTYKDILWKHKDGTPDTCCPVAWNDLLFTITDDGIARCFDRLGGNVHWKERLKGKYKASPIAAESRVYFLNTEGVCTVISAQKRFDKLLENTLDDETIASPAVSDRLIFIRGKKSLYCLTK